jgi:hypothetical protein
VSATQELPGAASDADETPEDGITGRPDEDGPHDVPDDKVIEKTLPSTAVPERPGG